MSLENVFEISPADSSTFELLWRNNTLTPRKPVPMTAGVLEFDRGDYPLLLVVSKRVWAADSLINADVYNSTSYTILVNDPSSSMRWQMIYGGKHLASWSHNGTGPLWDGFYRTVKVVENGLQISDCQLIYGTYYGSTDINYYVIPYQIYGIR